MWGMRTLRLSYHRTWLYPPGATLPAAPSLRCYKSCKFTSMLSCWLGNKPTGHYGTRDSSLKEPGYKLYMASYCCICPTCKDQVYFARFCLAQPYMEQCKMFNLSTFKSSKLFIHKTFVLRILQKLLPFSEKMATEEMLSTTCFQLKTEPIISTL